MADKEHLAILKQGVPAWNEWREKNEEIRLDLSKANLREADLSEINLREADLSGVNLRWADLSGADLSGTDLRKVSLIGANLREADLREADLSGANLSGADLRRADLSEANLREADLGGANLIDAKLVGTDLITAILSETNLSNADLREADLRGADLRGANLQGVKLRAANFEDARFGYTIFANTDLSAAKNLHLARHSAPSTIGIDTLYRSKGNIPEIFLRGCGVDDTMIAFAKSLVGKAIDFYSCFISYSTADEAFAKLLYDTLQGQGIRCWFAPEQILPGERIDSAIDYGIRYWDKVIFCASKSSLTEKWWVDFEVDKAFKKARDLQRERGLPIDVLIPLNLDGYLFSPEYEKNPKRSIFETILAADFVGWESDIAKFNREVKKVIRAIQTDGGKEDPPPSKL